jgi:hypothetical protein
MWPPHFELRCTDMQATAQRYRLDRSRSAECARERMQASNMMQNRPFVLLLILELAGSGCAALDRAHDCSGVADIVNGALVDVRFDAPDAGDPEAYQRFAATYDDVSKQIGSLSIEDAALAKAVGSYRDVLDRAAKHSRAFAKEMASSGSDTKAERRSSERRLERIRAQAKTDLTREASAVRKINTLCHPR